MIVANKSESSEEARAALVEFRKKIETARHAKFWNTAQDLASSVVLGMTAAMKTKPRVGWVRADLVPDESAAQEILGLRRKVDELTKQVDDMEFRAPEGSKELAQGEETFPIHFKYEHESKFSESSEAYSWNNILSILGPILIVQASEQELKKQLGEAFRNRCLDNHQISIRYQYMRDEDFQQIKLQLRALGLIRETKNLTSKNSAKTWTLTPYGDRIMTQVAAIRSSARA